MAESIVPAVTPGNQTSEFHTTKLVIYMGIAVMVVGFLTDVLTAIQVLAPQWLWVGVVLIIVGKASMLLKALGYDATRASIKNAAIATAANQTVQLLPVSDAA